MTFELFKKLSPPSVFHVEHAVSKKVPDLSRWAAKLSLPECDAVIICGAGKGLYPRFKGKKIAIVEPDPGLLKGYLETDEAKWLLEDPNGLLVGGEPAALQLIAWSMAESQVQIASAPERRLEEFAEKVLYGCAEAKQVLHEYFQGGAVFYRSYYRNLEILPEALDGAKLFGAFSGVPAVICGAGPSLKKNVHLLQGLREKAVIFAGGSALNALFAEGVEPHFGVGVDPNPTQYYRMMGHGARGVPFFFRPRMHFEALAAVYGPKLFLRGAGGYPTAEWFEEQLGIEGEVLVEGHNVVNLSVEIARALGCNPLIFVGLDLAYTDLKAYAKGVVDNPEVSEEEILSSGGYEERAFKRGDLFTTWKWVAEAEWLSVYQKNHPDLELINATEGGLEIPGIAMRPLGTIALEKEHAVSELVKSKIAACPRLPVTAEKLKLVKEEFAVSIQRALSALTEMQKFDAGSTEYILAESDLEEEPSWEALLALFDRVMTLYQEAARRRGQDLEALEAKKLKFLAEVGELNLKLLTQGL